VTKETCVACRFYKHGTSTAFPQADGMCRRWAPQGVVIGCQNNGWQVFPPMMGHQWCGEFRPASEADCIANLLAAARAA